MPGELAGLTMLRRKDDRGWPQRLQGSWAFAVVLACVLTLCLPRERASGPVAGPPTSPPASPASPGALFRAEPAFLLPPALGALACQTLFAHVVEAALGAWPRHVMSAEDFRRLYEGDPGDYAGSFFEAQHPGPALTQDDGPFQDRSLSTCHGPRPSLARRLQWNEETTPHCWPRVF